MPYCGLYDLGYTSLGGRSDTRPNPVLLDRAASREGALRFRPAHELVHDHQERLGRDR